MWPNSQAVITVPLICVVVALLTQRVNSFLILPFLGASVYQTYLEQGIRFRENPFLGNLPILREYDFVVVGGGPSGCVVANRLSENPNWKILLLEAGDDENIYTDIPAPVARWTQTGFNWGYHAERTVDGDSGNGTSCLAMEGERCLMPKGKVLGGSSVLNYMIYTRGHRRDYNGYEAAGNVGWGYDSVLPYFLKSENTSIPEYQNSSIHSHAGYLNVERVRYSTVVLDAYLKGSKELGYKEIDYTAPTQYGYSRLQTTQRRGRRVSAAKAYLKPNSVKNRANLHVAINSRVTKILIDPHTKRATGVEFVKNNKRRLVFARKEVILSAGGINSPQLLLLSGVGPKEHLKQVGIPCVHDLKGVGENLNEHYSFIGLTFVVNKTGSTLTEKVLTLPTFLEWLNKGKGPLTIPGGVEALSYIKTKYNKEPDDYTDIEFIFSSGSFASDTGAMRKSYGITDCMFEQYFSWAIDKDSWTILPMLLHPKSKGRVSLFTKNPWHAPKIEYNYFGHPDDMKVLVEGIKEAVKLSETSEFKKMGVRLNPQRLPQCSHHPFKSDQYWECTARYFTGTLHHQCGTCKMGPAADKSAVVDPRLKVYGIKNLRVVDASILPYVPGAHLYAPSLMIGEKASDMIKQDWPQKSPSATTQAEQTSTHSGNGEQTSDESFHHTSIAPCFNETYPSNKNNNVS